VQYNPLTFRRVKMKQLPSVNDLVKIISSGQICIVRHVLPEQNRCKIVKVDPTGAFVSLGYIHIEHVKKVGSVMVS
jgi:hypothetical protein